MKKIIAVLVRFFKLSMFYFKHCDKGFRVFTYEKNHRSKYMVARVDDRDNTDEKYIVLRIDNGSKTAMIAREASMVYINAMKTENLKAYQEMKAFFDSVVCYDCRTCIVPCEHSNISLNKDTKVLLTKSDETQKFISELEKICTLTVIDEHVERTHALYKTDVAINGKAIVIKNKITGQYLKVKNVSNGKLIGGNYAM